MRCMLTVMALLTVPSALSAQWALRGDHLELVGKTIIDVGAFIQRTRARVEVSPLLQRAVVESRSFWMFEGRERRCLDPAFVQNIPESDTALFLKNQKEEPYLAVFVGSGEQVSVTVQPVVLTMCPPNFDDEQDLRWFP